MLFVLHPASPHFDKARSRLYLEVVRACTRRRKQYGHKYYPPTPFERLSFIEQRIRSGAWKTIRRQA